MVHVLEGTEMNFYDYCDYLTSVLGAFTYPNATTNAEYTVDFGEKDKVVADVEYVELSSEPVKEERNEN